MFRKHIRMMAVVATLAVSGMALPACSTDQAVKEQVKTLEASNANLTKQVQGLEQQVKVLHDEMAVAQKLIEQTKNVIDAQSNAMSKLQASIKNTQPSRTVASVAKPAPSKASSKAPKAAKSGVKKAAKKGHSAPRSG